MSKSQTTGLYMKFVKKKLDMMGLGHNEVNFEAMYGDQKTQNVHIICF